MVWILSALLLQCPKNYHTFILIWKIGLGITNILVILYWAFNQAIPAWVITMLVLNEKDNKNIIFIYSCMFLHSTLPAIGILPVIFYLIIKNSYNKNEKIFNLNMIKTIVTSVFSVQNILGGLIIVLVSYFYLSNNLSSKTSYTLNPLNNSYLLYYLLFIFFEIGLFLIFLLKKYKNNILFYIMTSGLLFYPFIIIGKSCDFCMRATIPLFVILYLFILKYFDDTTIKNWKLTNYLLIIALLIGAITPLHEMSRTIYYTKQSYTKVMPKLEGDNFFGRIENNKFLKYFGKNKI